MNSMKHGSRARHKGEGTKSRAIHGKITLRSYGGAISRTPANLLHQEPNLRLLVFFCGPVFQGRRRSMSTVDEAAVWVAIAPGASGKALGNNP